MTELIYSVSDFIADFNQVIETAFGSVKITGELSNYKISKNKWVYFDLKDDNSSIRFFGTVYQLPGPLEDGMVLTVRGVPQLHARFGFNVTIQSMQFSGEGTIKKAAQLLEKQLAKEGLFDESRKRPLPYPPERIGLVTSRESAAYADFMKIINQRWGSLDIFLFDVQVQGEEAPRKISKGVAYLNTHLDLDIIVVIRGGGSADDLQAFNTEQVTRAIAASRVPTVVAIGHEVDFSLAELAADRRASTPSNAAEILTPDRNHELHSMMQISTSLKHALLQITKQKALRLAQAKETLEGNFKNLIINYQKGLAYVTQSLELLNPNNVLKRGYAIVFQDGKVISSKDVFDFKKPADIQLKDGTIAIQKQGGKQ